jgi:orotidine-5'-phosphate decarboxylase
MKNAIDNLIEKIKETNNPTVIGLDPRYDIIPNCIKSKYEENLEGASKAIIEFNKKLIDKTYDIIPAIKPQIAFYEMFGCPGINAFEETCKYAKSKGMVVIRRHEKRRHRHNSTRLLKCLNRKNNNRRNIPKHI